MKWANVSCKGPGGTPGFFFQMLQQPLSASNFIKKASENNSPLLCMS